MSLLINFITSLCREAALKTRQAVKKMHDLDEEELVNTKMILVTDDPSPSLTTFSGYVQIVNSDQNQIEISPLDLSNLLLRVRSPHLCARLLIPFRALL